MTEYEFTSPFESFHSFVEYNEYIRLEEFTIPSETKWWKTTIQSRLLFFLSFALAARIIPHMISTFWTTFFGSNRQFIRIAPSRSIFRCARYSSHKWYHYNTRSYEWRTNIGWWSSVCLCACPLGRIIFSTSHSNVTVVLKLFIKRFRCGNSRSSNIFLEESPNWQWISLHVFKKTSSWKIIIGLDSHFHWSNL